MDSNQHLLTRVGLLVPLGKRVSDLTMHQRQLLQVACALASKPALLLLDEPTAAIDDVAEKQLIDHLKVWLGYRTLIVATHRRAVLELVDRIIVMNDGKVVMDGPRDQVLNQSVVQQKQIKQGEDS